MNHDLVTVPPVTVAEVNGAAVNAAAVIVPPPIVAAVRAAESKKGYDAKVLNLSEVSSFTDHFLIVSGNNPRQTQAISDEIGLQLAKLDEKPSSIEGYDSGEWILMDYGDLVIHIFHEDTRAYYDLERLWGMADEVAIPAELSAVSVA